MTEDGDGAPDGGVPDLDLTSERDGADPFAADAPDDGGSDSTAEGDGADSTAESGPDATDRDAGEGSGPDATAESDPVPDVSPPNETDDDEVEPVELLVLVVIGQHPVALHPQQDAGVEQRPSGRPEVGLVELL